MSVCVCVCVCVCEREREREGIGKTAKRLFLMSGYSGTDPKLWRLFWRQKKKNSNRVFLSSEFFFSLQPFRCFKNSFFHSFSSFSDSCFDLFKVFFSQCKPKKKKKSKNMNKKYRRKLYALRMRAAGNKLSWTAWQRS